MSLIWDFNKAKSPIGTIETDKLIVNDAYWKLPPTSQRMFWLVLRENLIIKGWITHLSRTNFDKVKISNYSGQMGYGIYLSQDIDYWAHEIGTGSHMTFFKRDVIQPHIAIAFDAFDEDEEIEKLLGESPPERWIDTFFTFDKSLWSKDDEERFRKYFKMEWNRNYRDLNHITMSIVVKCIEIAVEAATNPLDTINDKSIKMRRNISLWSNSPVKGYGYPTGQTYEVGYQVRETPRWQFESLPVREWCVWDEDLVESARISDEEALKTLKPLMEDWQYAEVIGVNRDSYRYMFRYKKPKK